MSDRGTPFCYTIRLTARHLDGSTEVVEFEDYGLLRELLDDITDRADRNGWFVDPEA